MSFSWQSALGLSQQHLINFFDTEKNKVLVHAAIFNDLNHLMNAAKNDGIEIEIVSSFRDFDRQVTLWNEKWLGYRPVFSRHGRPLNLDPMSNIEKYKAISLWSALPGFSRHHWGTDLDIFSAKAIQQGHQVELVPEEFSATGICAELNQWLESNLSQHGFFRPYKTYQNGVSAEAWHISHIETSSNILNDFPYSHCFDTIKKSEIQAKEFICDKFEHYKSQYFLNICQQPEDNH